ncbi:MAG TPA: recombinase family protein [Candidatus Angelobacter sp.]|nr:recombinase family protein [Candidatus Angelobacter sp.]
MATEELKESQVSAGVYLRMSTEHQQYSTANQMSVISEFAKQHGIEIVKVYSDGGKSGLNIHGRNELARMIDDVQGGQAGFSCILVYDVSRWGRFQDADESAHYEYICRKTGMKFHYCAEQFVNDGSPVSTIVKGVKRAMAGEYSRELSTKVFNGACHLIQLGYKQGGAAGFGLRRMLVDQNGQHKMLLKRGEHKSIQTDRVILVGGPEAEVQTVQWIYRTFIRGKIESEIAASLNQRGILTDLGRPWTRGTVHQVLTNEKYIGNNIYHRTSFKLKQKHVVNPPEKWIRANGVFQKLIEPDQFQKVQAIILERSRKLSNDEMLEKLRTLVAQHGHISGILIDETEGFPSSAAYRHRFGSLVAAYRLIGYDPEIDYSFIEINRKLRKEHREIVSSVIKRIEALGAVVLWDEKTELLCINDEFRASIVLCRHTTTNFGSSRWVIRLDASLKPDITIAVRMNATNEGIRDYYLLPAIDMTWEKLRVADDNGVYLDTYRYDSLDYFLSMAEQIKLKEAA